MIHASVLGATGYAGAELVRLLCGHKDVVLTHLYSKSYAGKSMSDIYPSFEGTSLPLLEQVDILSAAKDSDVVFTSLPHGTSSELIPSLYKQGVKVVDLSGDFRYRCAETYEQWYNTPHPAPELLKQSVYGLPELHREAIKKSRLVGNPGCYTTCAILALAPLLRAGLIEKKGIIIDAKSGTSGAGRSASLPFSFCEVNESFKAYKVAAHRHTSEIEQELSVVAGEEVLVSFTPHLLPIQRGILSTIYADYKGGDLSACYEAFYQHEPFVKVSSTLPELKQVVGSNFCKIGFVVDERLGRVIIISVLDNLVKGAAGQAIQNMNLLFGLDETTGLNQPAWYL
ncbi:MAG: N-acetyl-gamma-glutamyl-phosphate reductase [Christensenellales bacterium]